MNKTATATVIVFTEKGEKIVTSQAEARILLKAGKAKVIKTEPFTLKMLDSAMERDMVAKKEEKKINVNADLGVVSAGKVTTNPDNLDQPEQNLSMLEMIGGSSTYEEQTTDVFVTNTSLYEIFICTDIITGSGASAHELIFEPGVATNITRLGLTKDRLLESQEFINLLKGGKLVEGKLPSYKERPDLYKKNPKFIQDINAEASRVAAGAKGTTATVDLRIKNCPYVQKLKEVEEEEKKRNEEERQQNAADNYSQPEDA